MIMYVKETIFHDDLRIDKISKHHKNCLSYKKYKLLLTKQHKNSKTESHNPGKDVYITYISQRHCIQEHTMFI